jgi:hypothetical protein
MNLERYNEGGEPARKAVPIHCVFRVKFPTLPHDAIPNAAAATVAHRPPARVICLAPALARPKRLHYTPFSLPKASGISKFAGS